MVPSDAPPSVPVFLIHEATFNDDRASDAVTKRHSTVGEAARVGAALRDALAGEPARAHLASVILTHFSQR
jgi:ribonuclease BN (tRNA processing enzyme)